MSEKRYNVLLTILFISLKESLESYFTFSMLEKFTLSMNHVVAIVTPEGVGGGHQS